MVLLVEREVTVKRNILYRIAMILPEGYLDSVPSLISAVEMLDRRGYGVDLFLMRDERFQEPELSGTTLVRIYWIDAVLEKGTVGRVKSFFRWSKVLREACTKNDYRCFIGVDTWGLLPAVAVGSLTGIPVVYYSLEIIEATNAGIGWQLIKYAERMCHRRCSFTIVQDHWRAALLAEVNHIATTEMMLVPNSYIGIARRIKSDFLARTLGITPGRKIILCAGSLRQWTMALEIMSAAHDWPEELALVMQTRQRLSSDKYDQQLLRLVDNRKVFLCAEPVPRTIFGELVSSADIGIALYRSNDSPILGRNLIEIGLSSGKIASYLQHGLPVVVNGFPSLKSFVRSYGCGKVVNEAEELQCAIHEIFIDYNRYVEASLAAFTEKYDFENSFGKVIAHLEVMKYT